MVSTDFYVTLPSTAGEEFAKNKPNDFKVRLPQMLRFPGRGWKVGLSSISLPDARVSVNAMSLASPYLFQMNWSVQRGNVIDTNNAHVQMSDIDVNETVVDGETLMRACLDLIEAKRVSYAQFGDKWTDTKGKHRQVKYEWVQRGEEHELLIQNKDIALQGKGSYAKLYLDVNFARKMGWLTEKNELGPHLRQEFIGNGPPDIKANPHLADLFYIAEPDQFVYWKVFRNLFQLSLACNWRFIHLNRAFDALVGSPNRTLHVYSDVGASGVVGNQVTDLLREIQYVRRGQGTSYYESLHLQYVPLRVEVIEVVETQVSETDGTLVRFGSGQTLVTLHFKQEV